MEVGVIGAGNMGKNHVRIYSEMRRVSAVHVFDTNSLTLQSMERQFGAIPSGSVEEVLKKSEAVSICVPTGYHYRVAEKAVEAGVHQLIEKPICATAEEGRRLLSRIPSDLILGVGHIERFNPIVKEMQRIISDPCYVEMKRHNPASARVTGSSVIEDLMIHDIDIAFHLFPNGEYSVSSAGDDDVCAALLKISRVPVYLSASRRAAKKMRSIYIECRDATVEGNFMTQEVVVYRRPGQYAIENQRYVQEGTIEMVMVNKVEPLKLELTTFLDCVERHEPFPVTPEQAVRNLVLCEEIRRGCAR
ncbi:MAG: Gfo/Idh/MocA family oxidoreductase [Methanomicrobiales archaeon]|nr:Gfo/Idh/MocA family oxidoreductase [Methanomicrobiales archaeon]